jgi:hypothetical protein
MDGRWDRNNFNKKRILTFSHGGRIMTKNRAAVIVCVLTAIFFAFMAGTFLPNSQAQGIRQQTVQAPAFPQLEMVTYISGMTGFFDRNTGMIYVYDINLEKIVFVRQLVRPGDPLKKIQN